MNPKVHEKVSVSTLMDFHSFWEAKADGPCKYLYTASIVLQQIGQKFLIFNWNPDVATTDSYGVLMVRGY